jgi:hypothetical protein
MFLKKTTYLDCANIHGIFETCKYCRIGVVFAASAKHIHRFPLILQKNNCCFEKQQLFPVKSACQFSIFSSTNFCLSIPFHRTLT